MFGNPCLRTGLCLEGSTEATPVTISVIAHPRGSAGAIARAASRGPARTIARRRLHAAALLLAPLLGCGTATEDAVTEVTQDPLLGTVRYGGDCTAGEIGFLDQVMVYGRVAAASPAFQQCMAAAVNHTTLALPIYGQNVAPYRQCNGDPAFGWAPSQQLAAAMMITHSENDVTMNCTGGGGNASTNLGTYDHADPEVFWWSGWLASVFHQLSVPVCGTPGASPSDCRFAPYPWPYSQAAGIVWHEASHTQGYTHGANDQANAINACGYAGDPTWNFQANTMPYLIGSCISAVIDQSGATCGGDLAAGCESGALRMITSFSGTTCACVHDPRATGLGLVRATGGVLKSYEIVDDGDWMGGWHYGPGNVVVATGDFDSDGRSDFVIRSGWGLAIVKRNAGGGFTTLASVPWGTALSASYTLRDTDTIVGVGKFDTVHPGTDLLMRSPSGLVVLEISSGLAVAEVVAWTTSPAGWPHTTDRIDGLADFDGDGQTDLLLRDGTRLGLARISHAGTIGWLTTYTQVAAGTWLGGWNFGGTEQVLGVGDFDGDGRSDFLLRSGWGIGTIKRDPTSGALTSLNMVPFGGFWDWWGTNATDALVGIADVNGDGRADLIWRSTWGIGINSRTTTGAAVGLAGYPYGTWFGGAWNFGSGDTFPAIGDFTGDGRADLVIHSGWGTGVLAGSSTGQLNFLTAQPMFDILGSWQVRPEDRFLPVGDFDGDGRKDLFLQR